MSGERATERAEFLARVGVPEGARVEALADDASFRSYYRIRGAERELLLMDAPPAHEDVRPFMAVARYLLGRGLSAPAIHAADKGRGFLLLEDFGDDLFSRLIARQPELEEGLYEAAIDLLVELHAEVAPAELRVDGEEALPLAPYDEEELLVEAALLPDWYLPLIDSGAPAEAGAALAAMMRALFPPLFAAPPVMVLRDYHADNLMWLPGRAGIARVGLLDFQDALAGHPAYDLVSLLRDARRDVPPALEARMIARYLAGRGIADAAAADAFRHAYEVLGAQRNIKIIGIFARLWCRDGKPQYLDLIPRVWGLLERSLDHPALTEVRAWLDDLVPVAVRRVPPAARPGAV